MDYVRPIFEVCWLRAADRRRNGGLAGNRTLENTNRCPGLARGGRCRRSGTVLVWWRLLLPVLLGMVGLVIDGGLLMATYRHAQNAADAAALLGANQQLQVLQGSLATTNTATVAAIVTSGTAGNNLTNAKVAVTFGYAPSYATSGGTNYVQVVVTAPITTDFMQVLPGFNQNRSVQAQAVAGVESQPLNAGVLTLGSDGTGISMTKGSVTLSASGANGAILITPSMLPPFPFRQIATPFKPQICKSSAAPSAMQARSSARCKPAWRRPPTRSPAWRAGTTYGGVIATSAGTITTATFSGGTLSPGTYSAAGGITLSATGTLYIKPGVSMSPAA